MQGKYFLMLPDFTKIRGEKEYTFRFCLCTIVTRQEEYLLMRESFLASGFTDDCQYLIADNTDGNKFDAYTAIRRFLQESDADFTVIVHQDVRCEDGKEVLNNCISKLEVTDPHWAVCGNAGGAGYKKILYHLDNAGNKKLSPGLPGRVFSLDENFLLIKTNTLLSVSADINSFHFYGTDLCLIADMLGYSSYVIPFKVKHLSTGNLADMEVQKAGFISKYGNKFRSRFIQTTCTNFYLSNSSARNDFFNSSFIFFWVKAVSRIKNLFRD